MRYYHHFRYFAFPIKHRKTLRNTNLIERVIREVRRRTKVMDNVIENEYSVYALMTGIFQEQNERWNKKSHWSGK
ncbi:MAG: transposase [Spirochaetota bacterium]|nr:transposase [Spirochaetota bacterium]